MPPPPAAETAGAMALDGMAGMDMSSGMARALAPAFRAWAPADFAFMFAMWSVMMVGMMTPSVAPMILLYAGVGRQGGGERRPLRVDRMVLRRLSRRMDRLQRACDAGPMGV